MAATSASATFRSKRLPLGLRVWRATTAAGGSHRWRAGRRGGCRRGWRSSSSRRSAPDCKQHLRSVGVGQDRPQRLVDLVRNGRRQLAGHRASARHAPSSLRCFCTAPLGRSAAAALDQQRRDQAACSRHHGDDDRLSLRCACHEAGLLELHNRIGRNVTLGNAPTAACRQSMRSTSGVALARSSAAGAVPAMEASRRPPPAAPCLRSWAIAHRRRRCR